MQTFAKIKEYIRSVRIEYIHSRLRKTSALHIQGQTVIIAPHPDDEVLGCGGLIARLVQEGLPPHVIIMTGGEQSHNGCCNISGKEIIQNRHKLTLNAMEILGIPSSKVYCLNFHDGGIAMTDSETMNLSRLINSLQPDIVLIPHPKEGWSDHVNTGSIVKELVAGSENISLYEYCVWFWYYNSWAIDWANAWLLKMTDHEHRLKLEAIDAYITPLAPCGNPWSGVLPRIFVKANRWNKELYFKVQ